MPATVATANSVTDHGPDNPSSPIPQIEAMAERVGKRMYRGLLKRIARSGILETFKMPDCSGKF
jgi:hypothetical protein